MPTGMSISLRSSWPGMQMSALWFVASGKQSTYQRVNAGCDHGLWRRVLAGCLLLGLCPLGLCLLRVCLRCRRQLQHGIRCRLRGGRRHRRWRGDCLLLLLLLPTALVLLLVARLRQLLFCCWCWGRRWRWRWHLVCGRGKVDVCHVLTV